MAKLETRIRVDSDGRSFIAHKRTDGKYDIYRPYPSTDFHESVHAFNKLRSPAVTTVFGEGVNVGYVFSGKGYIVVYSKSPDAREIWCGHGVFDPTKNVEIRSIWDPWVRALEPCPPKQKVSASGNLWAKSRALVLKWFPQPLPVEPFLQQYPPIKAAEPIIPQRKKSFEELLEEEMDKAIKAMAAAQNRAFYGGAGGYGK
jgi:hypothetical protein